MDDLKHSRGTTEDQVEAQQGGAGSSDTTTSMDFSFLKKKILTPAWDP